MNYFLNTYELDEEELNEDDDEDDNSDDEFIKHTFYPDEY